MYGINVLLLCMQVPTALYSCTLTLYHSILEMNGQADIEVDYKRKYKNLKRKLKFLVYVSITVFV